MNDLEILREMFKDSRLHIGIGTVAQVGLANDGSKLRVMINLLPENRQLVAEMTFADVYDVTFPEVNDLAIVGLVDGHPDDCFVLKLVSTTEEKIPAFARTGHSVKYSRPGKKLYLGSDLKVGIGRPNVEPTEPLVLGTVLQTYLTALEGRVNDLISLLNDTPATITTAPGTPGIVNPALVAGLEPISEGLSDDKDTYLTEATTNILSQIGFTERGA